MKIIKIVILLFFLSGCSASWHISRALEKDPEILVQAADTSTVEKIVYRPVKVFIKDSVKIYVKSDTIIFDTLTRFEKFNINPFFLVSKDSISHAKIWAVNGVLHAEIWAKLDTVVIWHDSILYLQKEINRITEINRKTKVEIIEKMNFFDKVKIIGIPIISLIMILFLLLIIKQFKK
jgi:hypothetical protein